MDKHTIIRLKQEGNSNREVAKILGIERKTVAKYWNEFSETMTSKGILTMEQVYGKHVRYVSFEAYE